MAIKIRINKQHKELTDACHAQDYERAKAIIESGLDLQQLWTADGYPLYIAYEDNNIPLIRLLLDSGMPLYVNTKSFLRGAENKEAMERSYLFGLLEPGLEEACLVMLEYAQEVNTPEARFNGLCSLAHLEDRYCNELTDRYLERLLAMGADVDYPSDLGCSLLHYIVDGVNSRYVPLLIRLSKDIEVPGNDREPYFSPLFRIANQGKELAVQTLLEMGANPNKYSPIDKRSILDWVERKIRRSGGEEKQRLERIAQLLRDHGAKTYQQMLEAGEIDEQ